MSGNIVARKYFIILLGLLISTCSGSVRRLQVMSDSPTSIMVRWMSPTNDSSKYFRLFLNDNIAPACTESVESKNYTCTISNLVPNTNYEVMVKVCPSGEENLTNCENVSRRLNVHTRPQAPQVFTATAVDGESIEFTWILPEQNLEDLMVYANASSPSTGGFASVAAQTGANSAIVKKLQPLTKYKATLYVRNSKENIEEHSAGVMLVLTDPNAPKASITEVGETWMTVSLVPAPTGENYTLTYIVKVFGQSGYIKNCTISGKMANISCNVTGLDIGTLYSISTMACNVKQCSSESKPITQQTQNTPPPTTETTSTGSGESLSTRENISTEENVTSSTESPPTTEETSMVETITPNTTSLPTTGNISAGENATTSTESPLAAEKTSTAALTTPNTTEQTSTTQTTTSSTPSPTTDNNSTTEATTASTTSSPSKPTTTTTSTTTSSASDG